MNRAVFVPALAVLAAAVFFVLISRSTTVTGPRADEALVYSAADRDLMIRTVYGEAAHEPRLGQIAVAWVIRNRLKNPYGWQTISEVVTACGKIRRGKRKIKICQFEPWLTRSGELMALKTASVAYRRIGAIVDDVLHGRAADPTSGAWYFLNRTIVQKRRKKQGRAMPLWARNCDVHIGRHSFCRSSMDGYEANGMGWVGLVFQNG